VHDEPGEDYGNQTVKAVGLLNQEKMSHREHEPQLHDQQYKRAGAQWDILLRNHGQTAYQQVCSPVISIVSDAILALLIKHNVGIRLGVTAVGMLLAELELALQNPLQRRK